MTTYTFDLRETKTGRLVVPSPRREFRRLLREQYGRSVQLGGEDGSYFFLDASGAVIDALPAGHIKKMLRGDVESLLSQVATWHRSNREGR